MEIHNSNQGPRSVRVNEVDVLFDPARANRDSIRKSIQDIEEARRIRATAPRKADGSTETKDPADKADLSTSGLVLAETKNDGEAEKARLTELKRLHQRGELATPERLERAAAKLLQESAPGLSSIDAIG